ncbi:hypothetical protein COOONC_12933 [Cooperia oncophora]
MKGDTAPGPDKISVDMFRAAGHKLHVPSNPHDVLPPKGENSGPVEKFAHNCSCRCSSTVQLFKGPLTVPVGKGVRQGVPSRRSCSPQHCTDSRYLSNLRFMKDIVLFSSSTGEAEVTIAVLNEAGKKAGLRIN